MLLNQKIDTQRTFLRRYRMSCIVKVTAHLRNPCQKQMIWLNNVIYTNTDPRVRVSYSTIYNENKQSVIYNISDRLKNLEILSRLSYMEHDEVINEIRDGHLLSGSKYGSLQ